MCETLTPLNSVLKGVLIPAESRTICLGQEIGTLSVPEAWRKVPGTW